MDEFDALLKELIRRETGNKLAAYSPYPFQKEWHNVKGKGTAAPAKQKALMCANKIGKTYCGAHEDAFHLTGLYPDWFEGTRFTKPVRLLVSGVTVDLVRDTLQSELLGDPHDEEALGTGTIPRDLIAGKPIRKQGYVNAIDSVPIKHVSGGISRAKFLAYEQGAKKFYAHAFEVVHYDEEPPEDIYSQGLRSLIASNGIMYLTFTSEEGITNVVDNFYNELRDGQAIVMADWDDAPHIKNNPEHRKQLLEAIPPHEREMRSRGIPKMGSGLIFPVPDEEIKVTPFEIPPYWVRIAAIDFGGHDHPFACSWIAFDRENDTAYVYRGYKAMGNMAVHADAMKRGDCHWIPTAWPHDVAHKDRQSGRPLADIFRDDYDLNMLPRVFSNPPALGQKEGQGGQGVEAGLWAMLNAMETGRFKVFSSVSDFFREKGVYHRKEGKVVKRMDDFIDATRYAYQSLRFADIRPGPVLVRQRMPRGARNW